MTHSGRSRVSRGYGEACSQCRQKKRKCEPTGIGRCQTCDREGAECQFLRRPVKRASQQDSSSHTETCVSPLQNVSGSTRPATSQAPTQALTSGHARSAPIPSPTQFGDDEQYILTAQTSLAPTWAGGTGLSPFLNMTTTVSSQAPYASAENGFITQFRNIQSDENPNRSFFHGSSISESASYRQAAAKFVEDVCGDISEVPINEPLLSMFFVWQANHNYTVVERLFRRDMHKRPPGPFFSLPLLFALYAQASRMSDASEAGISYAEKAQALCFAGIGQPPAITTIQALLELGGRELALGQGSKGWLLCGMALRMVIDIGLHHEAGRPVPEDQAGERREEYEVRTRVFWSAYCWDKFFALTMGRQPTLPLPPSFRHNPLVPQIGHLSPLTSTENPNESDQVLWSPTGLDGQEPIEYAEQQPHTVETLQATCMLYRIVEDIIRGLYDVWSDQNHGTNERITVDRIADRLTQWRSDVDPAILLDTAYLPKQSPPPNILAINVLYRTAWILLKRPRTNTRSMDEAIDADQRLCASRSTEINALFHLHKRSFGLRYLTYFMAYQAYVSATVDMNEALHPDRHRAEAGMTRLTFTLEILTQAASHTPGIQRSITHLRKRLVNQTSGLAPLAPLDPRTTAHPSSKGGTVETRAPSPIFEASQERDGTSHLVDDQASLNAMDLEALFSNLLPDYTLQDHLSSPQGEQSVNDFLLSESDVWDWFANS